MRSRRLTGAVVLVTGASSGVGRAIAVSAAQSGAKLTLVARRGALLREVAADVERVGGQAIVCEADVTRADDLTAAVAACVGHFGRLDALVNDAGAGVIASFEQTTLDDFDRMLRLNFLGTVHGIRAALPVMRRQGSGHIINVASTAARRGSPYIGAYCASKFAVAGLTECLRVELLGSGIDVTLVCPGATRTPFLEVAVRRTSHHAGFIGPVETAQQVADRVVRVLRRPRAEVIVQPFRRKTFLMLNLLAPAFTDRLVAALFARYERMSR